MYHGVRNMRDLLESWGLDPGRPPTADPPKPDPDVDGYLLDASRRLAVRLTEADGHAALDEAGAYAADPLADTEAEELARGLRVVAETDGLRELNGNERAALVDAAVEQAVAEWRTTSVFGDAPELRQQAVEERLREAVERLAA